MSAGFQLRDRLGVADVVTLINAGIGLVAGIAAFSDPALSARLILLAAVTDALDGIIARFYASTEVGPLLDAISDVVSFGAVPAIFLYAAVSSEWAGVELDVLAGSPVKTGVALAVAGLFVVLSILRTALYAIYVDENEQRPGIQNTLAATILVTAYLAGVSLAPVLLVMGALLAGAMVAPTPYPKLRARDAGVLGIVQAGAIVAPTAFSRAFPRVLLVAAVAYMLLGPWFYWGE